MADDLSTDSHVHKILQQAVDSDPRIKVEFREKNGHISEASNTAIGLAGGEFIALLDNDDELAPDALFWVSREILAHPDVDIIFSDEDNVDEGGRTKPAVFQVGF